MINHQGHQQICIEIIDEVNSKYFLNVNCSNKAIVGNIVTWLVTISNDY